MDLMKKLRIARAAFEAHIKSEPVQPEPTSKILARVYWVPWSNGPRGIVAHASDLCPPTPRRKEVCVKNDKK